LCIEKRATSTAYPSLRHLKWHLKLNLLKGFLTLDFLRNPQLIKNHPTTKSHFRLLIFLITFALMKKAWVAGRAAIPHLTRLSQL